MNGTRIERDSQTIYQLLESEGIDPTRPGIAVAVNNEVVPKRTWGDVMLEEGMVVEIITAMQGG